MKLEPPIKHLLVDLDGTLLHNRNLPLSFDFARQALQALRKYGGWKKIVQVLLDIKKEFGTPSKEMANDVRIISRFAHHMNLPFEEGRKALKEGVTLIFSGLEKHFYPAPGSKEFLDWAKDHFALTLATNPVWPRQIIELRVKWAGIDPKLFQFITDVRTMHAFKPALEYYEEILQLQNLKAEDCMLIGNDVRMDLPATRVGIRVFIVAPTKTMSRLRTHKSKVPAWKGSYSHLRTLLETSSFSPP